MALIDPQVAIYEALTDDEALQALPAKLASFVGARSTTIQVLSAQGGLEEMAVSYFTPEMFDFYVSTEMWNHDIWRTALERNGFDRFAILDEVLPLDQFSRSLFYNEFLQPFGDNTAHCIGGPLRLSNGGTVAIGWHRPLGAEPFAQSDLRMLDPLKVHLKRLFEVREALRGANRQILTSEAALDANPNAVFVLDAAGRPKIMNRAAQALVRRGGELVLTPAGLRALHPRINGALLAAIAGACARSGASGGAIAIPRTALPSLRLIVSPLQVGGLTRALVVVHDPTQRARRLAEKLAAIYQLTPAEAETAEALSRGLAPANVASQRGVKIVTVRTQIRRLFEKLEVRSIPELVALVITVPGED